MRAFWLLMSTFYVVILSCVVASLMYALVGCAGALTNVDKGDLTKEAEEEVACIEAYKPNQAAIDTCRATVRAKWCGKWAERLDAGICN